MATLAQKKQRRPTLSGHVFAHISALYVRVEADFEGRSGQESFKQWASRFGLFLPDLSFCVHCETLQIFCWALSRWVLLLVIPLLIFPKGSWTQSRRSEKEKGPPQAWEHPPFLKRLLQQDHFPRLWSPQNPPEVRHETLTVVCILASRRKACEASLD